MLTKKQAVFFLAAVIVAFPASGFAAFNMTGPSTSSGGSGNAMGTATHYQRRTLGYPGTR